jgi:hypothetical protein
VEDLAGAEEVLVVAVSAPRLRPAHRATSAVETSAEVAEEFNGLLAVEIWAAAGIGPVA